MATSSENQGKTVGVVLAILGIVIGASVSWFYYDQIEGLTSEAQSARSSETDAQSVSLAAAAHYQQLRMLIHGRKSELDHDSIKAELDRRRANPNLPADRRSTVGGAYASFRAAITGHHDALKQADDQVGTLEKEKRQVEDELVRVEDQYAAQVAKELDAQRTEEAKFQKDKADRLVTVAEKNKDLDDRNLRHFETSQNLVKVKQERAEQENKLKEVLVSLQKLYTEMEREFADLERIEFEQGGQDGRIVRLWEGGRQADVNIGRQDGLRIGQTFGIYGRNVGGSPQHLPKARLEIVSLSQDRATGVITDRKSDEPVLPGDLLYTRLWSPGEKERVAFVGLVDIDGDGKPDNDRFRQLVEENGGTVVAEVDLETGRRRGTLGVGTNWLVLGDKPADAGDSSAAPLQQVGQAVDEFHQQARDRGVPVVSVANFLEYLRNQTRDRIFVTQGPRATIAPRGYSNTIVGTQRNPNASSSNTLVGTMRRPVPSSNTPVGTQLRPFSSSNTSVGSQQ